MTNLFIDGSGRLYGKEEHIAHKHFFTIKCRKRHHLQTLWYFLKRFKEQYGENILYHEMFSEYMTQMIEITQNT